MPRKAPPVPQDLTTDPLLNQKRTLAENGTWNPPEDYIVEERTYELITPLFGGGVRPAEKDPITPIRGAGIRGHLRFWWRATRGGQFDGDLNKMRDAEAAIWGAASTEKKPRPGAVLIEIHHNQATMGIPIISVEVKKYNKRTQRTEVRQASIGHPSSPYSYVTFPLRDKPNSAIYRNIKFKLVLRYPQQITIREVLPNGQYKETTYKDIKREVQAALWAWETFGGVGARTRRGFGALKRTDTSLPINQQAVQTAIEHALTTHIPANNKPIDDVPRLSTFWKVTSIKNDSDLVWKYLVETLKSFRQYRVNSEGMRDMFGKSVWPEPMAIRDIVNTGTTKRKFPRAMLGLPIIFEFTQQPHYNATLKTTQYERFASPLIIRPIACQRGAVGIAMVLGGSPIVPENLILKLDSGGEYLVEGEVSKKEAGRIPPLNGDDDAVSAFISYLQ